MCHVLFALVFFFFFFQAEDGIRDAQESRGLGDVYKRQVRSRACDRRRPVLPHHHFSCGRASGTDRRDVAAACLLYTSDAADDLLCVDLGGRRIIKKKKK